MKSYDHTGTSVAKFAPLLRKHDYEEQQRALRAFCRAHRWARWRARWREWWAEVGVC